MSCAADGKATVGFWERSAGGGCSIGGSLMCRTILGGLRGAQPAGADRLILGVSLMAPAPGDKSLCFIKGTRYGTRAASDRGGGSVVTNDSRWLGSLTPRVEPPQFLAGAGRGP